MSRTNDVVIVSIYGRGNWLASKLAEQGISVTLVDASESMGHWVAEDWEGPFGFFRSERLMQSQLQRLVEDDPEESVDQGFTMWLGEGPIEMKGPLSAFALDTYGVSKDVQKYLIRYDALSPEQRVTLRGRIRKSGFRNSWLAHFSHQLGSNLMLPNAEGIDHGEPLALFAPYYFRRVSRSGLQRGLDLCQKKGVRVLPSAKVIDIGVSKGMVEGIEVLSEFSGVLFAKNLVWMLSSEESLRFSSRVNRSLFPKGAIESDWFWTRFRLSVSTDVPFPALPSKLVVVGDRKLPWSHENLLCLEKTVKEGDLDVWARVPTRQRFHRAYVKSLVDRVCEMLSNRLALPVNVAQMPQDYIYDENEVGAPRHPIFSKEKLAELRPQRFRNVFYDGPESWKGLDWHSQFSAQALIEQKILSGFDLTAMSPLSRNRGPGWDEDQKEMTHD